MMTFNEVGNLQQRSKYKNGLRNGFAVSATVVHWRGHNLDSCHLFSGEKFFSSNSPVSFFFSF